MSPHGTAIIQHGCKMKINEIDDNVIQGPWKAKPKPKKISMAQAFGGPEYAAFDQVGIKFIEKPGSFSGIDNQVVDGRFVNVRKLKNLEEVIGRKINSYDGYHVLDIRPPHHDHPQVDADFSMTQGEETFILWFPPNPQFDDWYSKRNKYPVITPNSRYLVNRTGATKYIRMWVALVD